MDFNKHITPARHGGACQDAGNGEVFQASAQAQASGKSQSANIYPLSPGIKFVLAFANTKIGGSCWAGGDKINLDNTSNIAKNSTLVGVIQ